jgi:DNA-damage-inducible protein D
MFFFDEPEKTFEDIRHEDESGVEFWLARELAQVLQYSDWRNFENAIFKAMEACKNSGHEIKTHFGGVTTFTKNNKGTPRKLGDYALSRYACYLIVMNGDPHQVGKKVRQTIKDLGGTMPEDLPTPDKSISQIERETEHRKLKSPDK